MRLTPRSIVARSGLGLATAACCATSVFASGTYYNLGTGLTAYGVSADGSLVAGYGAQYFLWTADGGLVNIGGAPPGGGIGGRPDVSDDGSRVGGTAFNPASGLAELSYYDVAAQQWVHLGGIGGPCSTELSSGWGISGDGKHVVGLGWLTCSPAHATQWTEGTGTFDLGSTVPGRSSRANEVDFDGNVVVGWQDAASGFRQGAVWIDGVQTIILNAANNQVLGEASDVSADGTWVVGSGVSSNSFHAWRWSSATLGQSLGAPPVVGWRGAATSISADGSRIVGFNRPFPGPATFGQGFIWTEAEGMVNLNTWAAAQGVMIPAGVVLALPLEISADGNTIVGVARNANSTFAFVVTIDPPAPACPADLDGDDAVGPADLAILLGAWGGKGGDADLDGDGAVGPADLALLLGAWGPCL